MHFIQLLLIPQLVAAAAIKARDSTNRAAYFLDNNPAGSSIVALKIQADGTLSDPTRTSTGGKGLLGLGAAATGPPVPGQADTLFSQDAVVVSQDYLFTVNAGSNTISMFFINKDDPTHPTLISTAPTLGEFPQSVAYSSSLKTACVLNGGSVSGVSCFSVTHTGLKPLTPLLPLPLKQTTPAVGPPGTASDILFNPSSTALFVTIKGSPTTPGMIYAFPVIDGTISPTPILSQPSGLLLDFALSFLGSSSKAIIADPAYGASLLAISNNAVTVTQKITVPNQAAICWTAYSSRFNTAYLLDAGTSNITLINPETGDIKGTITTAAVEGGSFDAALDRTFLYVLKGKSFISVIDNEGLTHGETPKEVQTLDLSALGSRQGFQGLAIYPSS